MTPRGEIPFAPRPSETQGTHVEPPWLPIESRWEYQDLVRDLESSELPTETELNAPGSDGWELFGTVSHGRLVHFYFKRERVR